MIKKDRPKIRIIKNRHKIITEIRDWFYKNNFLEVETPIMTPIPGMEPHLTPFETKLVPAGTKSQTTQKTILYLNTSPELQMKKLLGDGLRKIYQITKVFRNGEIGGNQHNPEFTMLEWYRQKADYKNIMSDCENLITKLTPSLNIRYRKQKINLRKPWTRVTVNELFQKYCGIDLEKNRTFKKLRIIAEKKGISTNACANWDDIFFKIFLNEIDPKIPKNKPVFIYDYPATQAALAKKSAKNSFWAERFELYIGGIELANAFSELIDHREQRERLMEEQKIRKGMGKTVFPIDEDFLNRLKSIRVPCAGIALGIDRLIMLLTNCASINEVILFPLEKMIDQLKK